MPVDISKIVAQAREYSSNGNIKIPATTQYDDLWGYYTFSQSINFSFDEPRRSTFGNVTIVINGFYTINTEIEKGNAQEGSTDEEKCDVLIGKYEELRKELLKRVRKAPPEEFYNIGTSLDDRCIALPNKLVDNNSQTIYAIPVSFSTRTISPEILEYTATFKEPDRTTCKISVDDNIINDAVVSISCRKPKLSLRNYFLSNGGEAYFSGFDNRKIKIEGKIYSDESNSNSGLRLLDNESSFIDSISEKAECEVKIVKMNGTKEHAFNMYISSINSAIREKENSSISIEGEEKGS